MKKALSLIAGFAALSFVAAMPVMAADQAAPHANKAADGTRVKGKITKIDGSTITVGEHSFTIDAKTEIMIDKKAGAATDLKVGERITAHVKDGVAVRVEVVKGDKADKTAEKADAKSAK